MHSSNTVHDTIPTTQSQDSEPVIFKVSEPIGPAREHLHFRMQALGKEESSDSLKIHIYAQLLESENQIVLDSIDPETQERFAALAEKVGLHLDVSVPPKLAALLDNIQLEQATPRGATLNGEKLPYVKQIIFCDILALHHKIKHVAAQEKRERIERNRTAQLTQLDTLAKQRQFLDQHTKVNIFICQRALQAWDVWQEVNKLQSRLEQFKGKESLRIRLSNTLEQQRERLNHIVNEVDASLIIHEIKEHYPKTIKGKRLNLIEVMQEAANRYGRSDKKEDFINIIKGENYSYLSEAVSGSILENEWHAEMDMARHLLESAQTEFSRQAHHEGAFPQNLAEKIAIGQGIIYNNQPIVAGTFARQSDALAVFSGTLSSSFSSNAGKPQYYAYHPDTSKAQINLNNLVLIHPGQSDWEECINQAAELEDTINKKWIEQGDHANFNAFSQIVPEVAQRSILARTVSYSIHEHILPAPYFPYVITPDMAKKSRSLREIYVTQKAIVIGRNGRNFTVLVDTDIGEIKDENARFDALIHYALSQRQQLNHDTLNSYDGRWSSNGLKKRI